MQMTDEFVTLIAGEGTIPKRHSEICPRSLPDTVTSVPPEAYPNEGENVVTEGGGLNKKFKEWGALGSASNWPFRSTDSCTDCGGKEGVVQATEDGDRNTATVEATNEAPLKWQASVEVRAKLAPEMVRRVPPRADAEVGTTL